MNQRHLDIINEQREEIRSLKIRCESLQRQLDLFKQVATPHFHNTPQAPLQ